MKLLVSGAALAFLIASPVQPGLSQQSLAEEKALHVETFTPRGQSVLLMANSIVRDETLVRLRGKVEIKLRVKDPDGDIMVLRADEADYYQKTDEIVPRGDVRVKLERAK